MKTQVNTFTGKETVGEAWDRHRSECQSQSLFLTRYFVRREKAEAEMLGAGINTAIYSTSGTNSGIGFAIPVDTIRLSVEQILQFGKVTR